MSYIGNIELPLRKAQKVKVRTDNDVLDIIFDLNIEGMNRLLAEANTKVLPMMAVAKVQSLNNIVMVLMFIPPDIWLDFDGQMYQMYVAPTLEMMIFYFQDMKMKSQDTFEISFLNNVIAYLERFLIKQNISHTG
jgi:hypothetical protein